MKTLEERKEYLHHLIDALEEEQALAEAEAFLEERLAPALTTAQADELLKRAASVDLQKTLSWEEVKVRMRGGK